MRRARSPGRISTPSSWVHAVGRSTPHEASPGNHRVSSSSLESITAERRRRIRSSRHRGTSDVERLRFDGRTDSGADGRGSVCLPRAGRPRVPGGGWSRCVPSIRQEAGARSRASRAGGARSRAPRARRGGQRRLDPQRPVHPDLDLRRVRPGAPQGGVDVDHRQRFDQGGRACASRDGDGGRVHRPRGVHDEAWDPDVAARQEPGQLRRVQQRGGLDPRVALQERLGGDGERDGRRRAGIAGPERPRRGLRFGGCTGGERADGEERGDANGVEGARCHRCRGDRGQHGTGYRARRGCGRRQDVRRCTG
jgi:hypothetical protein